MTVSSVRDSFKFGDLAGEQAHGVQLTESIAGVGALGQPMRRFLPKATPGPYGGDMKFVMKVDPRAQNYITLKLWGEDFNEFSRHVLELEGFEVAHRRTPIIDSWNKVSQGRFWFRTVALPLHLTWGKEQVNLRLRSTGLINPYAALAYNTYQGNMKQPGQPLYGVWVHTDPYLDIPADEVVGGEAPQGKFLTEKRTLPDLLAGVKKIQEDWITGKLASTSPLQLGDAVMLGLAYSQGTQLSYYKSPQLLDRFLRGVDAHVAKVYTKESYAAEAWGGTFHPAAGALLPMWNEVKARFDETIDVGTGTPVKRRDAWAKALKIGMDAERKGRRGITNQILEANLGIYRANRALQLLAPALALPETAARRYIDEAGGLLPFSGADQDDGSSAWPMGRNWWSINPKGTTREPGWVGSDYGDVVFFLQWFWELTGDVRFRDKAMTVARARAATTYFAADGDGLAGMRIADAINTRNDYFPGRIRYADFAFAAATLDPTLMGWVQQGIDEGQFWAEHWRDLDFAFLDQWARFASQPRSNTQLPNSPGQPDNAWADEDDHIVTVKRGDEFLAANLFHRSGSIDGHVRLFLQSPQGVRHADIVADDLAYVSTGRYLTGSEKVDSDLTLPPDGPVSSNFGVRTMLAAGEDGDCPADWACGGRASAATLRFGRYLIGMNSSSSVPYAMKLPANFTSAVDMVSGKVYAAPVTLPARTSVVFYLDKAPQGERPARPTFFTAAPGNSAIALAWDPTARATEFNVLRADAAGGPYQTVASNVADTYYVDRNLTNGSTYYYRVEGVNVVGVGGRSPEVSAVPNAGGLPAPWAANEVTIRSLPGKVDFNGDQLTVQTASYHLLADTNKRTDDVFLVYQPWSGDGTITARVLSAKANNSASQSALSMRSSLDAGAAGASISWTSNNKVTMGLRKMPGDGIGRNMPSVSGCSLPCWLKLSRQGRVFSGFVSSDGQLWRKVGDVTVPGITDSMVVGPAATGNYGGSLSTSVFDNLSATR